MWTIDPRELLRTYAGMFPENARFRLTSLQSISVYALSYYISFSKSVYSGCYTAKQRVVFFFYLSRVCIRNWDFPLAREASETFRYRFGYHSNVHNSEITKNRIFFDRNRSLNRSTIAPASAKRQIYFGAVIAFPFKSNEEIANVIK